MDVIKSIIVWLIGFCYIIVTFPITLIVWLLVFPFDRERIIIHWFLTYQSLFLAFLIPIWTILIEGREKALKGTTYVIISNHQSILDILLINCLRYKFKWISKIEMLEKSYNCLKKGISIMIFPEGTRSPNKKIGFFKRGAFQLALQANVPILPVLIDGTWGKLPKHGLVFSSGHNIRIKVLDPIFPVSFGTDNPENLAQKLSLFMTSRLNELRSQDNP